MIGPKIFLQDSTRAARCRMENLDGAASARYNFDGPTAAGRRARDSEFPEVARCASAT
jgi:hypothetical protein